MSFTTNKPTLEGTPQMAGNGPMLSGGESASAINLQVIRSLRLRPTLAAWVAIAVLVVVVGYAFLQKSEYSTTSQLYVTPTAIKLLGGAPGNLDEGQYETFLAEQMLLVTRPEVLKAALDTLPASDWAEFGGTTQDAAANLTTLLKVQRVGTSRQVSIGLQGSNPVKTAAVVNAITSAYLDAAHKATTADFDQRGQLLAEEQQRIEGELKTARAEQIALGASMGVANPSVDGGNPYDSELSGIRVQLSEARAAHEVASAQLAALSGVGPAGTSGLMAAADEQILSDAGLASMKSSISQRKAQLTAQMAGMTATNPVYKQDQDEIADLDRTLDKMTADLRDKTARRLQDKLHSDLQRTGDIEARLNGQLARQIASATSAAPRLQRATEVEADIQRLNTRLATVEDALHSLHMEVSGPAQVRLSQPAVPASRPEANRKKQLLMLALPLAILFGIGAAVLARMRDKRIFIGLDIEDVLGFPPLVLLPARGDVSQRVFEEYILRLAAGIESAYRTGGARTFLLTSVSLTTDIGPLASALTRKFEEIGVNVVVATASDMLAPTGGVQAESAAPLSPGELARAVELWSEGFVAANVARMKSEHGLVLIESEALLNCAQTEYVARCADATILIVECGITTRDELRRAADLLHRLHVTGIGAVLEEIQLRYADVEFRKAIEALDRRQHDAVKQDRSPRPKFVPAEVVPGNDIVAPQAVALVAEPELSAEPVNAEIVHQVADEVIQDPTMLETEGDRVELDDAAAHYHEVLHHVRAARPFDHNDEWQLPVFAQVPGPPRQAIDAEFAPSMPGARPEDDEVVEKPSHTRLYAQEIALSAAAIDAANGSLHEKMTPRLSAGREQPTSDGDPGMTRRTSWIGKLLGRDAAPIVSILPETGGEAVDDVAPVAALSSSEPPVTPLETQTAPVGSDDYDASLANRLQQISGGWPVAAPAQATDIGEFKESHRLQVVAPEPVAIEATPAITEAVAAPEEAPVPVAEVAPRVRRGPAAWATSDETTTEDTSEASRLSAEPVVAPIAAPEVRRRLTFQELIARTANQAAAPIEEVVTDPLVEGPAQPEILEAAHQVAEPEPFHATQFPILGHVSEYVAAAPAVEAVAAEPLVEAHFEPAAAIVHDRTEPEFEEVVPEIAAMYAAEPAPEPFHQPVPEFAAVAALPQDWEYASEPLPEPMAAEVPEFHFSDRYLEESKRQREQVPTYDPYRPSPYELDDIEPVYQEASRNLNTGRWDPIPPLRPSLNAWRDRPSPVPANGNSASHQRNGAVKDGFNSYPPQRWIPEDIVPIEPERDPLSEPLLSRQWGLLSKFQQSRLSSSSHPVAGSEGAKDSGRDADRPESPYGNRRS